MCSEYNTIMIVDDESIFIEDLSDTLAAVNPKFKLIHQCQSPKKALEAFRERPCDVVFTDILMPGMDGIELAMELKRIYPDVIIVFITGFGRIELAQRAIRCGGYDFLLKPVVEEDLIRLLGNIEAMCDQKRSDRIKRVLEGMRANNDSTPDFHEDIMLSVGAFGVGQGYYTYTSEEYQVQIATRVQQCSDIIQSFFEGTNGCFSWIQDGPDFDKAYFAVDQRISTQNWNLLYEQLMLCCQPYAVTFIYEENNVNTANCKKIVYTMREYLRHQRLFCSSSIVSGITDTSSNEENDLLQSMSFIAKAMQEKNVRLLVQLWCDVSNRYKQKIPLTEDVEKLLNMMSSMLSFLISDQGSENKIKMEMFHTFAEAFNAEDFFEEILNIIILGMKNDDVSNEMLAARIAGYLRINMSDDITMSSITQQFPYNESYIHRVFKKEYSTTPMKYLNDLRIKQAMSLLRNNSSMHIQDVAKIVGFQDQYYFSKVFKRYTRQTPIEYQMKFNDSDDEEK